MFVTIFKGHLEMYNEKKFTLTILIHWFIPTMFSLLCAVVYELIKGDSSFVLNTILIHGGSIPFAIMGTIVALEIKLELKGFWKKIGILFLIIISNLILNMNYNNFKYYEFMIWINAVYVFLVPLIILFSYYRVKATTN